MLSVLIDGALPARLFDRLHARLASADLDPFNRHSYWFVLDDTPRLLVEHAIAALTRFIPDRRGIAGVEWWIEAVAPSRGVRWHFDVDHEVVRREGRHIHPRFGGILYFGSVGGPTVIVDQTACGEQPSPARPAEALVYAPRPNRLGVFAGELRHAVAACDGSDGALRLTMPLNWWPAKPEPPTCLAPPYGDPEFECLATPEEALGGEAAIARVATPDRLGRQELDRLVERDNRPVWTRQAGTICTE